MKFFNRIKRLIGNRIYILIALVSIVGFVEGAGVTLFFPILQSGFGDDKLSKAMKFVFDVFHLEFSFALILALISVFFILRSIFLIFYTKYFGGLSANLLISLRRRVLKKIFTADYIYILKKEIGYMSNAINREISCVVEAFDTFAYVFNYTIYALVYLLLCLLLNAQLTFLVLIISPLLIIFMKRINQLTSEASKDLSFAYSSLQSILIQALSKFKYLKSTFSSGKISDIVDKENKKVGFLCFRMMFFNSLTKYVFEPVFILIIVGFLFYHVVLMKRSVNEIIFLTFLFLQIGRQFISAQSSYRRFMSSIGSIETLNNFEKELDENKEELNLDGVSPDFDNEIAFRDVTVIFPKGKKALDNVNIKIRAKSVVAFVGHSGSGKSTIANMLTGMIKPTGGKIFFGDSSYDRLNLKALREKIGYVTQEDIIFNASIKDNISLWDESCDKDRLKKIIEVAHITNFVNELPEKQDSMLGDNGLDISGGQRQRITIARELYKDAKLLILDEATSALDSESENQIYEKLKEFKGNKTMVVIAHRLSTIKNADYVYVMDEGRVVEEGTYEDLHRRRGEFTKMVEAQKLV